MGIQLLSSASLLVAANLPTCVLLGNVRLYMNIKENTKPSDVRLSINSLNSFLVPGTLFMKSPKVMKISNPN